MSPGSPQPQRRARVLIEDRAPDLRGELRVVRIAPVDLDEERPTARVAPVEGEQAGALPLCDRQPVRIDAELTERGGDERRLRAAGRGAERESDRGSSATATRKPATVPPGVRSAAISTPSTPSATIHRPTDWTDARAGRSR
jgi:hypothetical protein